MALNKLDKPLFAKLVAITTYGDMGQKPAAQRERPAPDLPAEALPLLKLNCVKNDPACDRNAGKDMGPHLMYDKKGAPFHAQSAAFIVAGFKGLALPKVSNEPVAV
jgi:hypothetical protein